MAKVELNLGECKDTLTKGLGNLTRTLKERKDLSLVHKAKLIDAIAKVKVAHKVLQSVKCDQPEMSLPIPPPPPYPSARRPSRGKSRKRR